MSANSPVFPGSVQQALTAPRLVYVPFREGHQAGANLSRNNLSGESANRAGTVADMNVAAYGSEVAIGGFFRGQYFGVQLNPVLSYSTGNLQKAMGVIINNRACRLPKQRYSLSLNAPSALADGNHAVIIATDLPANRTHEYKIVLAHDGSNQNQTWIHGLLLSKDAGYPEWAPVATMGTPSVVTWSVDNSEWGTPMAQFGGSFRTPVAVRQIRYYNPTLAAISVTIKWRGVVMDYQEIASKGRYIFDPGCRLGADFYNTSANNFLHQATATGLYYTAIGES